MADRLKHVEYLNKKFIYLYKMYLLVYTVRFLGDIFQSTLVPKTIYESSPECLGIYTIHLPCCYMLCPRRVRINCLFELDMNIHA
jgi:hypothetical protein